MRIVPRVPQLLAISLLLLLSACAEAPPAGDTCASADECGTGFACTDGVCVRGRVCTGNGSCRDEEVCRNAACVVAACSEHEECGEARVCFDGQCRRRPAGFCESDAECPGARCNTAARQCELPVGEEGCGDGAACGEGEECVAGQCVPPAPAGCTADGECRPGTYCAADGTCESGCRLEEGSCGVGRVCDEQTHRCRDADACDDDFDCQPLAYCQLDGLEGSGACVRGCRVVEDNCGAGRQCDEETRACVDLPCEGDDGCEPGAWCNAGACMPGCRLDPDDCSDGQVCDAGSRQCAVARCADDAGCPADRYCADGECREGCRAGGCGEQVCDLESRVCRCEADGQCPAAEFCDGGACREGCREAGCPEAHVCDPQSRACVEVGGPCDGDAACPGGTYCADGACVGGCRLDPDDCGAGRRCVPESRTCACADDTGCPEGQYCDGGACRMGCRLEPDSCAAGACNPETRACEAPRCTRDADCAAGQACGLVPAPAGGLELRCVRALANGRAEAPCAVDVECATRLCLGAAVCFSACARDQDCPSLSCGTVTILGPDEGDQTDVQSCLPPLTVCSADAECPERQVCLPRGEDPNAPGRPLLSCGGRPPGAGTGEACAADGDCSSNTCLDGICWGPCRRGQAGDCRAGQVCYDNLVHFINDQGTPQEADDTFWGLPGCAPDMGSGDPCPNARCPGAEVCLPQANRDFSAFEQVCRDPVGPAAGGAACNLHAQCRSGVCLMADGFCLGLCDPANPAGQCAAGARCIDGIGFTLWDRGTPNRLDDVTDELAICIPL